jgi:hypothetical protein
MSAIAQIPPQHQQIGPAAIACADPGDSHYKIFKMTDTQASVNGKIVIADVGCGM